MRFIALLPLGLVILGACSNGAETEDRSSELRDVAATSLNAEADRVALEAACVRERGYAAWADGVVLFVDSGSEKNSDDADRAVAECVELVDEQYPRLETDTWSSETARVELYSGYLETWECLREQGYELATPPSLDSWLESWDARPWNPYRELVSIAKTKQEWTQLNEVCPQVDNSVVITWQPIPGGDSNP